MFLCRRNNKGDGIRGGFRGCSWDGCGVRMRCGIIKAIEMISAVSGGSTLPREVLQWLDGLDLSYSIRNPRRDLANGFIIAEMLTRHYPSELSILTFYNAQKKDKKIDNWRQIQKCTLACRSTLSRVRFLLTFKLYFSPRQTQIQNHPRRVRVHHQPRPRKRPNAPLPPLRVLYWGEAEH